MRSTVLCLWLLLLASSTAAQVTSRVHNPRNGSIVGNATVDTATVLVRPKGAYAQVDLYLTFAARDVTAGAGDTLEFATFFSLPADADVTDSWLWLEDQRTIVRAKMLDVWSAGQIYETIVNRVRRDPSILFKRSATNYELRIYPVRKGQQRRVKLTYLVPLRQQRDGADVVLPAGLLTTSSRPVIPTVIAFPDSTHGTPFYPAYPQWPFRAGEDATRGRYMHTGIGAWVRSDLVLRFPRAWPTAPRLDVYQNGTTGWYALTTPLSPTPRGRKIVLGLNLRLANLTILPPSTAERMAVLNATQKALHRRLAPNDSLLVFAARDGGAYQVTPSWVRADSASIARAFADIGAMSDSSHLTWMLPKLVDAARAMPQSTVLLVNASDVEATFERANPILNALPSSLPRLDIFDVSSNNRIVSQGNRTYRGNEYLDQLLTQRGSGIKVWYAYHHRLQGWLEDHLETLYPMLPALEVQFPDAGSVTYGRLEPAPPRLDRPFVQVGRFSGTAPRSIRLVTSDGTSVQTQTHTVTPVVGDSTLRAFWWGQELRRLEGLSLTSGDATQRDAQVLAASLRERVLTRQTAFLALEPSLGGVICYTCRDDGSGAPVDAAPPDVRARGGVTAMPNPFRASTRLRIALATPTQATDVRLEIYDALGRRVRTLRLDASGPVSSVDVTWDGRTDAGIRAAAGTYIVSVSTPHERHNLPVIALPWLE